MTTPEDREMKFQMSLLRLSALANKSGEDKAGVAPHAATAALEQLDATVATGKNSSLRSIAPIREQGSAAGASA